MGARGVRKTIWTPEIVRSRIRTSQIMRRLTDHILGTVDMKPSQVTAALGLLRKTLPDLSQVDHSGRVETVKADELSNELLAYIATASSPGITEQTPGESESSEVH